MLKHCHARPGSSTRIATLCFLAHRPAPSNCSECKNSASLELCSRRRGDVRITERVCTADLYVRLSSRCWLIQPFTRTDFSRRAFRFSAQSIWNSMPRKLRPIITTTSKGVGTAGATGVLAPAMLKLRWAKVSFRPRNNMLSFEVY